MFAKLPWFVFAALFGVLFYTIQPRVPMYIREESDWRFRFDIQIMLYFEALFFPLV